MVYPYFVSDSRIDSCQLLLDGLMKFVETGELDATALLLLWRDIDLDRSDFESVVKMFIASDFILHSISQDGVETNDIVFFRLPKNPPPDMAQGIEQIWPDKYQMAYFYLLAT